MTRVLSIGLLCLLAVGVAFAQTPPTPTNLTAEQINAGSTTPTVKLTWHSTPGNWGFRIYRSANDTSHFQSIGMANATMFQDHMVVVGTRYYYFVKAVSGNQESGRSNIVNILVSAPPPPAPPPTPASLTATLLPSPVPGNWGVRVKLNWSAPRGAWDFRIYRSANDTSHFMSSGSTRDTFFTDPGVMPGTRYFYYVKSVAGNLQSGRSNVVDILVVAPPRPRGTIGGTVIDDSTSAPIRGVLVQFFRVGNAWSCMLPVITDSLGRYSALLDTGRYIIKANAMNVGAITPRYRPEYFDNCPEPSCATIVAVAESSMFTANLGLARLTPPSYAYVSGNVKDTANHPLRNARVSLLRTVQEMNYLASLGFTPGIGEEEFTLDGVGHTLGVLWTGWTDSLGNYRARVISNRNYLALASKEGYLPQYYNHKATVETADTIRVTRDTSGFNFNLAVRPVPNNSVSGRVVDSTNVGVPSRIVLLPVLNIHPGIHGTRYGHTDSLGNYTLTGIEAGKYFLMAMPFSNYASAFYKAGGCGVIRIQDADTVNVTGNITGINICVKSVHHDGLTNVRGIIRSSSTGIVAGVRVVALDAQGEVASIGITDARGAYELNAVAPGPVTIVADRQGYHAAQIPVTIGANIYTLDNVNITMSPSSPTSIGDPSTVPEKFSLDQNYPNPFNPDTKISYSLSAPSVVTLKVFNILGQEIATLVNGNSVAGDFQVLWNGKDNLGRAVSSGVYMYKLHATAGAMEFLQTRKMLLLK